jgi:hypothetical protein
VECVVHDDVERAELVERPLHEGIALAAIGDVGDRTGRATPGGFGGGDAARHRIRIEIAGNDIGALRCELHADRTAQTRADSRYERSFSFEQHVSPDSAV